MAEYWDLDYSDLTFTWDEEKDQINLMKHGIHFRTAAKVFLDPRKLIREDLEHPEEERMTFLERLRRFSSWSVLSGKNRS